MKVQLEKPPHDPTLKRGGKEPRYMELLLEIQKTAIGEWAIIERSEDSRRAYNLASNLRRGGIKVPKGRWEFCSQKTGDCWTVYGRALP